MTETQATDKQQAQLTKHKLHNEPWSLSSKEAWTILNEFYEKDDKPAVVRPGFVPKVEPSKPTKEFHLSPEQVNTNALNAAIQVKDDKSYTDWDIMKIAERFKEFIENGN